MGGQHKRKDQTGLDFCDSVRAVENRVGSIRIVEMSSSVPR